MNKKILAVMLVVFLLSGVIAGCGGKSEPAEKVKVGMVTDAGTIDDKSFNQGTWEGIVKAEKDLGVEIRYLKPVGTTEADYIREISNLVDAGFKFIVCPVTSLKQQYLKHKHLSRVKFVLIDGSPHAETITTCCDNTVAVFFDEHESGIWWCCNSITA
jgi:basic membrane protein A